MRIVITNQDGKDIIIDVTNPSVLFQKTFSLEQNEKDSLLGSILCAYDESNDYKTKMHEKYVRRLRQNILPEKRH